jgi:hypothetical protein
VLEKNDLQPLVSFDFSENSHFKYL